MSACAPLQTTELALPLETEAPPLTPTEPASSPTDLPSAPTDSANDSAGIFALLPPPACDETLTPSQTEGPYYTPDTPERNSLLEEGMPGESLLLIGYVLDQNCNPIPRAWLDFWQADSTGEYDNAGYTLRGHQFTDEQGRYFLETVMPGLYSSRPIRHIHVKVQPPGGQILTSQLYFPEQPVENLTVQLIPQDGYQLGLFNFVVNR
ncbi:MAG: intradiol ring-cleavage dioxygenase [Anaerolineales bacterium]|nr:intradiol ring-cleavage dioxygenase [Anaerolineales bacterium]